MIASDQVLAEHDLRRAVRWQLRYAAELDAQLRTRSSRRLVIKLAECLSHAERLGRREARA